MKQFKLLFSLMITAALFALAGCGSNGNDPVDIGTKILELDKKVKLQGAIHSYRSGEALPEIEVRLFLNGNWVTSTAEHNGEYFFDEVFSSTASNNSANELILTFVEVKTKKLDGDGNLVDGNELYANGTAFPSYPDSRVRVSVIDPEHLTGIVNPDIDSINFGNSESTTGANGTDGDLELGTPFKPDIVLELNTVRTRDIRLVPAGTITGKLVNSDNQADIAGATVTINTDALMNTAATTVGGDDLFAGWDNSIPHATSAADGSVVFSSATGNPAPALDYATTALGSVLHAEKIGFSDKSLSGALLTSNTDIRDDLIGDFGIALMDPFKIDMVTVKLTVLDDNFAALPGAVVTVSPTDVTSSGSTAYNTALAQGIVSVLTYTATTDASGVVTLTIPAFDYDGDKDFTVTYTDGTSTIFCLKQNFSSIVNNLIDIDAIVKNDVDAKDVVDLGAVCIEPKAIKNHESFIFQVVYNGLPVQGAVVTGYYTSNLDGALTDPSTFVIAGGTSDASGFVTLLDIAVDNFGGGTEKIVLTFDLTAVTSQFDGSFAGKKYVLASPGTLSTDKLTTTLVAAQLVNATVATGEAGLTSQVVLNVEDQKLTALTGYIVKTNTADNTFIVADAVNLALTVTGVANTIDKTYFATTDATGFYSFSNANGVLIPVGTNVNLDLKVLGDFVFSNESPVDNSIDLDTAVTADNGVEQLASPSVKWLWQYAGGIIAAKYDTTTLVVHTAAIQDVVNANDTGYHVVTVSKSIGASATQTAAVVETDGDNDIALTFTLHGTEAGNSAVNLNILLSGNVNTSYSITNSTAAPAASDPKENRVYVTAYNAAPGSFNNENNVTGEVFVHTAVVSGRTITITPEGNANKFQEDKIYKIVVKVWDENDNESDDVIYVKFYDASKAKYFVAAPTLDFNNMSNRNWKLSNATATVAANFRTIVDGTTVSFVVNNVNTGFGGANAGLQSEEKALNAGLVFRFPIPTDSAGTTVDINDATVIADIVTGNNHFYVWAQAYTQSGIILRHWTKVTGLSGTNGSIFNTEENGFFRMAGANLAANAEFKDALLAGHKIDIVVVHENNIIAATAANSFTLSVANLAGVQPKSVATGATYTVVLSEKTDASAASVPTMAETVTGLTLSDVKYTANDTITAAAVFATTGFGSISTDDTANTDISSDTIPGVSGGTQNATYLSESINTAGITTISQEIRAGIVSVEYDANGDGTPNVAANVVLAVNTLSATITQVDDYTNEGGAADQLFETAGDQSTTTSVDLDWNDVPDSNIAGAPDMSAALVIGGMVPATGTLFFNLLAAGPAREYLNNIEVGDVVFMDSANLYLRITALPTATSLTFILEGDAAADIRDSFGFRVAGTNDDIVLPKSIKTTSNFAANAADGTIDANGGTTALRTPFVSAFTIANATTVVLTTAEYPVVVGDTLYFVTENATSTTNKTSVFSATVTGSFQGSTNTVVTLSAATKLSGWATGLNDSLFTADNAVFYGEQVTVGLGAGVGSLENINTSGTNAAAGTGDIGANPNATMVGNGSLNNADVDDIAGTGGYEAVK